MIFKDKEILAQLECVSTKLDRLIAMQTSSKIRKAHENIKSRKEVAENGQESK